MESIFYPELNREKKELKVTGAEAKHVKALRIKIAQEIMVTNGKGLSAIARMQDYDKTSCVLVVKSYMANHNEIAGNSISLALGVLENRERFEFALEKAIELGIAEFYPIISEFSASKLGFGMERMFNKSIAAIKQSKRSVLPIIHEAISLEALLDSVKDKSIVLADAEGGRTIDRELTNPIVIVGPEGGFSASEIEEIEKHDATKLRLSATRLRSETAAIAAISNLVQLMI